MRSYCSNQFYSIAIVCYLAMYVLLSMKYVLHSISLEHFIKDFYIPLVFDTFKKQGNKILDAI